MNRWLLLCALVLAPLLALAEEVPPRTADMAQALAGEQWSQLAPGLDFIRADSKSGTRVTAFEVSANDFSIRIAVQADPDGERVDAFGGRDDALLAINGGFFGEKEPGKGLYPVGLLRAGERNLSAAWTKAGGYLAISADGFDLRPTGAGVPDGFEQLLQSKPMLIEPGGKWAMNTNSQLQRWRSLLCLKPDGNLVIALVAGFGLSLFEAGWLMRGTQEGGYFGCDSALALDGGGSSQLWVRDRSDLSARGETPVHNAVVVVSK